MKLSSSVATRASIVLLGLEPLCMLMETLAVCPLSHAPQCTLLDPRFQQLTTSINWCKCREPEIFIKKKKEKDTFSYIAFGK